MRRWVGLAILMAMLAGCGDTSATSDEQAAAAAVQDMLALAEAGDWGQYVDRYYGESHKFESPADRDKLVERFRGSWGERVTPALREAAALTPTIIDDKAVFGTATHPTVILHRDDQGGWTFHL